MGVNRLNPVQKATYFLKKSKVGKIDSFNTYYIQQRKRRHSDVIVDLIIYNTKYLSDPKVILNKISVV